MLSTPGNARAPNLWKSYMFDLNKRFPSKNRVVHIARESPSDGVVETLCGKAMGVSADHVAVRLIASFVERRVLWSAPPTINELVAAEMKVRAKIYGRIGDIVEVNVKGDCLEVVIVGSELTPTMLAARWSARLHRPVEVKEEVMKNRGEKTVLCVSGGRRSITLLKHRLRRELKFNP